MQDIANIGNIFIAVFDEMLDILLFHTYENYSICLQIIADRVIISLIREYILLQYPLL